MQLYQSQNNLLLELNEEPFKLEKEIQSLFEKNLENFTDLKMIKSEFTIKNNRIDTLAFDAESNAFVIIEYKRDRNYSVVDQGVSYLNLMLEYKADFIIEYNESQHHTLKRTDIDWSQSRILFVSPSFTDFQKQSTNFKDLGIELWEIKRYQKGIISIHPLQKSKSAPSIKQVQKAESHNIQNISKQIQNYDEEYHLNNKSEEIKELYEAFRNAILNLSSNFEINPKKLYIAFKKQKKNIVYMEIYQKLIRITLNAKITTLDDTKHLFRNVSNIGHWGVGDYQLDVSDTHHLEYILSLIKELL